MPELPEVENVARTLRPRLVGRRVVAVETSGLPLRQPIDRARLARACAQATVEQVKRIGKYLLIELSSQSVLLAHLGMSGRMVFSPADEPLRPHTHARFRLDGDLDLRFVDPRRFGVLRVYRADEVQRSPELSVLGHDPLEPAFTVEYLVEALKQTKRDLKAFLLDQSRIAGLGNIYVSEALYVAGLRPGRRAHRVSRAEAIRLHGAVRHVLELGIANRGTSFSDYVDADGERGSNQDALSVYGREGAPCRRCGTKIRRIVQANRSTFYCPRCQPK